MKRLLKVALIFVVFAIATITVAKAISANPATTPAATNPATPDQAKRVVVSPEEQARIEQTVHDYLMKKPEVIMEAVQNYQRKQYEEAEKTVKETQQNASQFATPLFHTANDPVVGDPNGKVTIVEFFDYQCPHCVEMASVMESIMKANPTLRVVYKDWPIRGPLSDFTARAALAANKQGKYYVFSHAVLQSKDPLTEANVLAIAKTVGLNVDQLKKDMDDNAVKDQVKATFKLAQDLKLFGTPAFFIGMTNAGANSKVNYVPGQLNQQQLQDMINKAGQ